MKSPSSWGRRSPDELLLKLALVPGEGCAWCGGSFLYVVYNEKALSGFSSAVSRGGCLSCIFPSLSGIAFRLYLLVLLGLVAFSTCFGCMHCNGVWAILLLALVWLFSQLYSGALMFFFLQRRVELLGLFPFCLQRSVEVLVVFFCEA